MAKDYRMLVWRLRPNSAYLDTGLDGYAAIGEWRDANTTKPTLAECDAEDVNYQAELQAKAAQAAIRAANAADLVAAQVDTMLTQIDGRRTQIASDITALAAASTLAAVKPIVQRMLNAEDIELLQIGKVLKFLRWLAG